MSGIVKAVEIELGFMIFKRTASGVELTTAGEMLLNSLEIILAEEVKITNISDEISYDKCLSICCSYWSFFMEILIAFERDSEAIDSIRETGTLFLPIHLIDGSNRIGLYYYFRSCSDKYKAYFEKYNLTSEVITQNIPLEIKMSQNHPCAAKTIITREDLKGEKLVVYGGFDHNSWLSILGFSETDIFLELYDRGGLNNVLRYQSCIAVTPKEAISDTMNNGIISRPLVGIDDELDVNVLYHRNFQFNSREHDFLLFLKKQLNLLCHQLKT